MVGQKEKGPVEAVLPECTAALGKLYRESQEGPQIQLKSLCGTANAAVPGQQQAAYVL